MKPPPVLIPLTRLHGFHVWQGNAITGAVWLDRLGWRWTTYNELGKRFRYGVCDDRDTAIRELIG
jgi:hypothetical protein